MYFQGKICHQIKFANMASFLGQLVYQLGGEGIDKGGWWGISLFQPAASITLSEYMKMCCNIQLIIYQCFRKEIKNKSDGIYEAMKMDKKEVRDKIDNEYGGENRDR